MKLKKLLCAFACMIILFGGILFASCNKSHYDLKNFVADYGNQTYKNISFENYKYCLNLKDLTNGEYKDELEEITIINDNLNVFLADNITLSVEKGNNGVSAANRDNIKTHLEEIKTALNGVDDALDVFIFASKNSQGDELKSFYDSFYSKVYKYFVALSNLSDAYANIYFNNYMSNENVNYFKQYSENNVDLETLSNLYMFNARVGYQIYNVSQLYLIQNFRISAQNNSEEFKTYKDNVSKLNACKLKLGQNFSDSEDTKLLAVEYYNALSLLQNNYNDFVVARGVVLDEVYTNFEYDNSMVVVNHYKQELDEFTKVLISLHAKVQQQ